MPKGFGYRYDGLYRVVSYWQETGLDGFRILRFRIEKLISDDLLEATPVEPASRVAPTGNKIPNRRQSTITRIVRSTAVGEWVKQLHNFTCQICATRIVTPAGAYAETCHIKPLGRPHDGPDVAENILCLCPNCHVLLDELAVWINDDHSIGGLNRLLRVLPKHAISSQFIQHHRRMAGR
jgi:putative restriction endonuclease